MTLTTEQAWEALARVADPEIPVISVTELGIVRDVRADGDTVAVVVTPTYSGCPATEVIEQSIAAALREAGAEVTVLDDLSTGHAEAVPAGVAFVRGDAGDERLLRRLFAERRFDAVFHFAALSLVGESARRPLHYLARN
ncbi:MAG: iron-sulfur cluster assembly protein, partial [Burkholderiaceae bacterium]|nr:iron-sulfur cluster assembly protein [Burkholderiaceae bacterium]